MTDRESAFDDPRSSSLVQLVRQVVELVPRLIKDELQSLKRELVAKLTAAGIGIGMFAGAVGLLFLALGVLVPAAILGIATALPGWLAAIIVAVVLLLIAAGLALLGIRHFKKGPSS